MATSLAGTALQSERALGRRKGPSGRWEQAYLAPTGVPGFIFSPALTTQGELFFFETVQHWGYQSSLANGRRCSVDGCGQ